MLLAGLGDLSPHNSLDLLRILELGFWRAFRGAKCVIRRMKARPGGAGLTSQLLKRVKGQPRHLGKTLVKLYKEGGGLRDVFSLGGKATWHPRSPWLLPPQQLLKQV